jgi:polar amino acid transport system permease protein
MELFFHYLSQPYLLTGILYTLLITAIGLGGGLAMGIVLAGMQLSRLPVLSLITRAYAIIFRGTPLILQMIFCYNALPMIGIKLTAVEAGGLALALNEAPFIAEIIRGNVLGVDRGQVVAGQALGMTPSVVMLRVVAPQAIRSMVPALGNEAVSALKNSSLASVVSVQELTLRSTQLASANFDFFSVFFASGLMYLVLTGAVAIIQIIVEILLDLDLPTPQARLARLLPWKRKPIETVRRTAVADTAPRRSPPATAPQSSLSPPPAPPKPRLSIDREKRLAQLKGSKAALEIKALHKSYDGKTVLESIDLVVRIGEVVALLGPSGSGKSTLLRCINHLESWDSGAIRVTGRAIGFDAQNRPLSPRAIANERATVGVGMVFQSFNLFGHLTAKENIAGPLRWVHGLSRTDADTRARELLDRVGLSDRAEALPRHMSGGQQQRVAIARALAPNPTILLLDEPTSALDPELVSEVLDVIRRLAVEDGLTMMISTHQISFAREVADRAMFLADGSIIEEGPADVVLSRPKNARTAQFLQIMTDEAAAQI